MVEINSWSDSLTKFLKSSNEDERVIALFNESILPEIRQQFCEDTLNWLEIGVGDGNKTLGFANAITSSRCFAKINLTICEPSLDWIVKIESSGIEKQICEAASVDFVRTTIEDFLETAIPRSYDFISMVQVMYSAGIKNALLRYIDRKLEQKSSLIWVDIEDTSSDFNIIRKQLLSKGLNVVHSFADEYLSDLKRKGIHFKTFNTVGKICRIDVRDILNNDSHWIFPFTLGCTINEFRNSKITERKLVFNIVRSFVKELKHPVLNIPDVSILTFI